MCNFKKDLNKFIRKINRRISKNLFCGTTQPKKRISSFASKREPPPSIPVWAVRQEFTANLLLHLHHVKPLLDLPVMCWTLHLIIIPYISIYSFHIHTTVLLFTSAKVVLQQIVADVHRVRVDNIGGTTVVICEMCSHYGL